MAGGMDPLVGWRAGMGVAGVESDPQGPLPRLRLFLPVGRLCVEGAMDSLGAKTEVASGSGQRQAVLRALRPPSTLPAPAPHLARVQPVLHLVAPSDAWQRQAVEDVLAQRAEQSTAQAQAEQHEESREVVDAHLEGLWAGRRHKTPLGHGRPLGSPGLGRGWGQRLGERERPGAVELDWKARAPFSEVRCHGRKATGTGVLGDE